MLTLTWWQFIWYCICNNNFSDNITVTIWRYPVFQWLRSKSAVRNLLHKPTVTLAWPYYCLASYLQLENQFPFWDWSKNHEQARKQLTEVFTRLNIKSRLVQYESQFMINLIHKKNLNDAWFRYLFHILVQPLWGEECVEEEFRQLYRHYQKYVRPFFKYSIFQWPLVGQWCGRIWAKWFLNLNLPGKRMKQQSLFGKLLFSGTDEKTLAKYQLLFCFVFEFVYEIGLTVIQESVTVFTPIQQITPNRKVNETVDQRIQTNQVIQQSIRHSFFSPWRLRWDGSCLVLVDLVQSDCLFSIGLRSCLGQGLVTVIFHHLCSLVHHSGLRWSLFPAKPLRSGSTRPLCQDQIQIQFDFTSRDLTLPYQINEQGKRMFHVTSLSWDPIVMALIQQRMQEQVEQYMYRSKITNGEIVLVAPEARAWLFAAPLAQTLHIPLIVTRKIGKEKGTPVFRQAYHTAYSDEEMEISTLAPLAGKHVLLIDDGLSSGGSISALCDLIKRHWPDAHVQFSMSVLLYSKKNRHIPVLPTDHFYLFEIESN